MAVISENLPHDDNEESNGKIFSLVHIINHVLQSCPPTLQRLVIAVEIQYVNISHYTELFLKKKASISYFDTG